MSQVGKNRKLTNTVFSWYIRRHYRKNIQYFLKHPFEVQQDLIDGFLQTAKDTVWGKFHDFQNIRNYKDFKQQLPITDYPVLQPYIQRMMNGEPDVLWPGQITWFSKSSGTTAAKCKYIPVTNESLQECHLKGGHDIMAAWCHHMPQSKIFSGKGMGMGGSHAPFSEYPKTNIGDVSAIMMETMPFYGRFFFTPDLDTALMGNFEDKLERMAHQVINENVTNLSGVPSWTLVLFRRILEITGKSNMLEVWPNFELYIHGGVSFKPYREEYKRFFPGDQVHYLEVYNASEGFFGAQLDVGIDDIHLLLDNGVFYEFIPAGEWDKKNPTVLGLNEVELGKSYALVITTNAGLWRYMPGDTVVFTSINPFKIKITGRMKHFLNVFGEEVIVENTDQALAYAATECGATINEYTVGPVFMQGESKGGHEWLVEFIQEPSDLDIFSKILDDKMKDLNADYEAKRFKSMALESLKVVSLKKGSFHEWLKSKGKYGGQHKVPRLSNDRKYVDEILEFVQKQS